MKLSIIIPVFQVEDYIARCLQSIVSQDCSDCEIILVDDATKDNSMAIAHEILDNADVHVQYLKHDKNRGLSAARNTGISNANGSYLLFVDSDDVLADGALKIFINSINNTGADCIVGNYMVVSDTGSYISKKYSYNRVFTSTDSIINAYSNGDIPVMAWNKCVKTDLIKGNKILFKEGIYHEDELWTFLLVNEVNSLAVIGIHTYSYFVRSGSIMTNTKLEQRLNSGIVVYSEMVKYVNNNSVNNSDIFRALDVFAFWRYRDIFSLITDTVASSRFYLQMRNIQKGCKRGGGKYGAVAFVHLILPASLGYNFLKSIIKRIGK